MEYKKYILKQQYPGLPVEWKVGDIVSITDPSEQFYAGKNKQGFVHKSHVLETQYWKEVVEKEYEVLSFKKKEDKIDILTVKNLFTDEIFNIGDHIKSKHSSSIEPIKSFEVVEGLLRVNTENMYLIFGEKHIEKKIYKFISEDGKKMFVGDTYWYIGTVLTETIISDTVKEEIEYSKLDPNYKRFSSKSFLEEYLFMNVRKLSLQDIHNYMYKTNVKFSDLKNLVIQRLKEKENG